MTAHKIVFYDTLIIIIYLHNNNNYTLCITVINYYDDNNYAVVISTRWLIVYKDLNPIEQYVQYI